MTNDWHTSPVDQYAGKKLTRAQRDWLVLLSQLNEPYQNRSTSSLSVLIARGFVEHKSAPRYMHKFLRITEAGRKALRKIHETK